MLSLERVVAMRCMACGTDMILTNVVSDETMVVAGFQHHTFMCSACNDIEHRLIFAKTEDIGVEAVLAAHTATGQPPSVHMDHDGPTTSARPIASPPSRRPSPTLARAARRPACCGASSPGCAATDRGWFLATPRPGRRAARSTRVATATSRCVPAVFSAERVGRCQPAPACCFRHMASFGQRDFGG